MSWFGPLLETAQIQPTSAKSLPITSGSFVITGTAVALKVNRRLAINPGVFTLTGQHVDLTWAALSYSSKGLNMYAAL